MVVRYYDNLDLFTVVACFVESINLRERVQNVVVQRTASHQQCCWTRRDTN